MALFDRGNSGDSVSGKPTFSVIAEDMVVGGGMTTRSGIQVDGVVRQNVHSQAITVGVKGRINGDVSAEVITVNGLIEGDVICRHIEIGAQGCVNGTISCQTIAIAKGGVLNANVRQTEFDAETHLALIEAEISEKTPAKSGGIHSSTH